ncbi:MAG: ABC-F family ATP-binding cassette domain-containing protein [Rubricoccaceae bacterium]
MALLSLDAVRKSYGTKPLLEDVSFSLAEGERVGVIGRNGSGKTTLLRLVAGAESPDGGRIFVAPGRRVAYLPQQPPFDPAQTVLDAVFAGDDPALTLLRDYEAAARALEASGGADPDGLARVADLAHRLDVTGGWDLEATARAVLDRLGLPDPAQPVGALSGGGRKRVALARALVLRPDLLVLDEPTNHLDAETVAWLEAYLARFAGALLVVTHDRYFLDRVAGAMIELEGGRAQRFEGGYARYVEQKAAQAAADAAEEQKRAGLARRELAWLRRGARARTTKQKARVERAEALLAEPRAAAEPSLALGAAAARLGTRVVTLHGVAKRYDAHVILDDFSLEIPRRARLGVIGPNGTGKTTLLDIIAGRTPPDAGTVEVGQTVVIGYYDQESRDLPEDVRVIDYVREVAENIRLPDGAVITASQMLERFLFPPAQQYTPVGLLSGGERRRLYLLRLLMQAPNVLLLDEPTNDFDVDTLVALEAYLDDFPGALVVVSHDRYFLDRTAEHIVRFEGAGRVRLYPGNYAAFEEVRARETAAEQQAAPRASAGPPALKAAADEPSAGKPSAGKPSAGKPSAEAPPAGGAPAPAPRKLSFNERRELSQLEARIAEAEARTAAVEAEMAAAGADFARVAALSAELHALAEALERDVERWAELAERA